MSFEMSQSTLWDGNDIDLTGYSQITILCTVAAGGAYTPNIVVNGVVLPIGVQYSTTMTTVQQATVQAVGFYYIPIGGILRLTGGTGGTFYVKGSSLPTGLTPYSATTTLAASTNAIGDTGVYYRPSAAGAASSSSIISPASPAVGTIKVSTGRIVGWHLNNSAATLRSVKLFNATAPTLGTTAAAFEIDIPAGGNSVMDLPGGVAFTTASTWSVTSAKGLTDNTSTGLALADVSGVIFFA